MTAPVDLHTRYLGFKLRGPLVIGASPVTENLDLVQRLVDAGAGAVVMNSLFEEQLAADQAAMARHVDDVSDSFAEALSFFPQFDSHHTGPDLYLKRIERLREVLPGDVPVIASLNGTTAGGWTSYARQLEDAGAQAIELNVFHLPMDPDETAAEIEDRYVDILDGVKDEVELPVAVKLSPFFSSPVHFMRRMADAGADGLVLFNRFYQPDIDIEHLTAAPTLRLSDSSELLLRLRWLAAAYGRVESDLCATGGVHTAADAIKAMMAGASCVQLASLLLHDGLPGFQKLQQDLVEWLSTHEYGGVRELVGTMSLERCPDPDVFTRANYVKILKSWHG
ncbi:dihydroorotate dehydrogenase-like protein [Myxococcota bacterium]|jgi:dihydroorotate dehydrogenase (fumarate)|nr:dihydroorotate dehydrogenase-like protein [Myxococcota bacterium]